MTLPCVIPFVIATLFTPVLAFAATQEEFFKSVQQSVSGEAQTGDGGRVLALLLAAGGLVAFLLWWGQRRKAAAPVAAGKAGPAAGAAGAGRAARDPGNPRKLLKEVSKQFPLGSAELRHLKLLAEEQGYDGPVTLLACPSLLIKVVQDGQTKADRNVLAGVARRLIGK